MTVISKMTVIPYKNDRFIAKVTDVFDQIDRYIGQNDRYIGSNRIENSRENTQLELA